MILKIFHEDEYKIFDNLIKNSSKKSFNIGPLGWVQIYMNAQKLKNRTPDYEGFNLVIANGREFVAQKIFNVNDFDSGSSNDLRDYNVSHFAVGSGGATVTSNIVTLNGPYICDTGLYEPINLGNSSYLGEPSNYSSGGVHDYNYAVKPINTDGSILLESASYTGGEETCSYYTKMKCTCTVTDGEPSGLETGASVQISEAGLYFVNNTDAQLFAHICFPPKWKEKESTITIIWYILC